MSRALAIGIIGLLGGYIAGFITLATSSSVSCGGGDVCGSDSPRLVLVYLVGCAGIAATGMLAARVVGAPLWGLYAIPAVLVLALTRAPYTVQRHWPFNDGWSVFSILMAVYCVIAVSTAGRTIGGSTET